MGFAEFRRFFFYPVGIAVSISCLLLPLFHPSFRCLSRDTLLTYLRLNMYPKKQNKTNKTPQGQYEDEVILAKAPILT